MLAAPELAGHEQTTNEGPDSAVVPTVHYKRATRLCMLPAEMLFTLSLESSRKRPMRARPATPCVQKSAQSDGLPGRDWVHSAGSGVQRVAFRWLEAR